MVPYIFRLSLSGIFEFGNGTQVKNIDLTCVNDEYGGQPYWLPAFDHDATPFPKCVYLRKY